MVAYTKPQERKKEESDRLRGERDQIKFIGVRFERWQVVTSDFKTMRRHAFRTCDQLYCSYTIKRSILS